PATDEFGVPDLALGFYDWVIAFDHQQGRAWLFSTGFPELNESQRTTRAQQKATKIRNLLHCSRQPNPSAKEGAARRRILANELSEQFPVSGFPHVTSTFDRSDYLDAVEKATEYIHAGDCFQVNLAQRLLAPAPDRPVDLYRRLRERNPAPFAGYFDLGDFLIASASPERFVKVE